MYMIQRMYMIHSIFGLCFTGVTVGRGSAGFLEQLYIRKNFFKAILLVVVELHIKLKWKWTSALHWMPASCFIPHYGFPTSTLFFSSKNFFFFVFAILCQF